MGGPRNTDGFDPGTPPPDRPPRADPTRSGPRMGPACPPRGSSARCSPSGLPRGHCPAGGGGRRLWTRPARRALQGDAQTQPPHHGVVPWFPMQSGAPAVSTSPAAASASSAAPSVSNEESPAATSRNAVSGVTGQQAGLSVAAVMRCTSMIGTTPAGPKRHALPCQPVQNGARFFARAADAVSERRRGDPQLLPSFFG